MAVSSTTWRSGWLRIATERSAAGLSQFSLCSVWPVAGDDLTLVIDQDRVAKAEPLYALGDLADLLLGVRPRIAGVRFECLNGKHFDRQVKIEIRSMARRIAAVVTGNKMVSRETRGFFETAHGALHKMESKGTDKKKKAEPDDVPPPRISRGLRSASGIPPKA
jgi:hypothetical protein